MHVPAHENHFGVHFPAAHDRHALRRKRDAGAGTRAAAAFLVAQELSVLRPFHRSRRAQLRAAAFQSFVALLSANMDPYVFFHAPSVHFVFVIILRCSGRNKRPSPFFLLFPVFTIAKANRACYNLC